MIKHVLYKVHYAYTVVILNMHLQALALACMDFHPYRKEGFH